MDTKPHGHTHTHTHTYTYTRTHTYTHIHCPDGQTDILTHISRRTSTQTSRQTHTSTRTSIHPDGQNDRHINQGGLETAYWLLLPPNADEEGCVDSSSSQLVPPRRPTWETWRFQQLLTWTNDRLRNMEIPSRTSSLLSGVGAFPPEIPTCYSLQLLYNAFLPDF